MDGGGMSDVDITSVTRRTACKMMCGLRIMRCTSLLCCWVIFWGEVVLS